MDPGCVIKTHMCIFVRILHQVAIIFCDPCKQGLELSKKNRVDNGGGKMRAGACDGVLFGGNSKIEKDARASDTDSYLGRPLRQVKRSCYALSTF